VTVRYWPRRIDITPQSAAPASDCAQCDHYRMALQAIVDAARQGVAGDGLGDLAELALCAPEAENRSRE